MSDSPLFAAYVLICDDGVLRPGHAVLAFPAVTGGTASMSFAGIPGYKYNVQVSTDLSSWSTLWTTNAPAGGLFQFTDGSAPTPTAYYRLMWNGT